MSEVKVYGDIVSQPVRSVLAFCKLSNIPHKFEVIDYVKGEYQTPEFTKINPFQEMPAILHDDYNLWESAAIVSYLAETFNIDNNWYPKDIRVRGRINSYLHWHHQNIRYPCNNYLEQKVIYPKFGGTALTEDQEAPLRARFNQFLSELKWLLSETRYVARTSQISIADIFAFNEINLVTGFFSFDDHAEIKAWYDEVSSIDQVKELTDACSQVLSVLFA
jgi:glutathione S-transferase